MLDTRGCLLPAEEGRLRLARAMLEEVIASAGRRGWMVRLADWLLAKE
ncbi:hypothetical protein DFAR_1800006 [Desulfarculales bacterium]